MPNLPIPVSAKLNELSEIKVKLKHTDHEIKKNVQNISRLIGQLKVVDLGIGNTKIVEII